ncbi:nitrogen regulatory IIA protein [Flavobacterium sp. JP2137]|uniref:nitrogen regulatory IIA protein n=1 Tax=Flavobacterium sp. JP2137 TaxID=3414510 RepID=UPI003D300F04
MKKLRANIDSYFDKLDNRFRALPLRKQHQYTLYFFVGYLLLTAAVIFKVWYDTAKSDNDMVIEHIENPVLKKKKALQDCRTHYQQF